MKNEKEINLAKTISDALNSGLDNKAFCEQMSRDHRFLQYKFTNLCLSWLETCAKQYEEGNYDGRNEYSTHTAKKLMDYFYSKSF